ncbi:spore gernimation protein GerQ [Paenibacillus ferrarius]|uniref:Spore gernimation protein GerQ n=1 Tax=Paenibacillus ferrarius TaxID=1469647 RepID=A0A1V4H976_9BACL|nr:spore coat protein [Paenibacillus ferrarius]OPH47790.1 spore gernimation protein GerQ [Paenibacillus ferrarius]
MQQQNPYNNAQQGEHYMNHGGHEVFDLHEVLACTINVLDQFMIFRQFVQDPELLDILDRQYNFTLFHYNLTAECFATGQKPSHETGTYLIRNLSQPIYGIKPTQPKKPNQSLADVKDAGISAHMLGLVKTHASLLTMTAVEVTNPAVRRVLASQVQNYIEMAYEIFLYQNRNTYYQVPRLEISDMQKMLNTFVPAQGMPQMPPNNRPSLH